jgi:hypothetical protein
MRVLIACEFSGVVRRAFRQLEHDAWSCDLLPAEDGDRNHIQDDVRMVILKNWDQAICHPPCTRLANSGVRWLKVPPAGRTLDEMWQELEDACQFYRVFQFANHIPRRAIENPVMHRYARARIGNVKRSVVQPWWFGEPEFKDTGFELYGLPPLVPTNMLTPPKPGT